MIKVHVNFRQRGFGGGSVSKTIKLAAVPQIGAWIEFESGWALETVEHLTIGLDLIEVDQYGPQFTEEEIQRLQALGWTVRR